MRGGGGSTGSQILAGKEAGVHPSPPVALDALKEDEAILRWSRRTRSAEQLDISTGSPGKLLEPGPSAGRGTPERKRSAVPAGWSAAPIVTNGRPSPSSLVVRMTELADEHPVGLPDCLLVRGLAGQQEAHVCGAEGQVPAGAKPVDRQQCHQSIVPSNP